MRKVLISIGFILLVGCVAWYRSSTSTVEPIEPRITLEASMIDRTLTPDTLEVRHTQEVTLQLTTNEPGEFHITGYELLSPAIPGKLSTFRFQATVQGNHSIEFHPLELDHHDHEDGGHDIPLGTISVTP